MYFEILGFEQSSAMQLVSRYARECGVDVAHTGLESSPIMSHLSHHAYGIMANGSPDSLQRFFEILESLFAHRLVRGDLVAFILHKLMQSGYTLCVAESCTGGVLSAMITAIDGASRVFKGGITAYNIDIKQRLLGVQDSIITQYGVYSEECVRAMARGALDVFQADIAIATSGLATQDTSAHNFLHLPAGMVFTCVLIRDRLPISIAHNYLLHDSSEACIDSRIYVQNMASLQALRLLLGVVSAE